MEFRILGPLEAWDRGRAAAALRVNVARLRVLG
jgi:hypothetical protein